MIREHKGKKYELSNPWVDLDLLDKKQLKQMEAKQ